MAAPISCPPPWPATALSTTLDDAPWGTFAPARIVRDDAAGEIAKLKRQPGKDMVLWGSLSLAQSLMETDLVDEFQMFICPLVLGEGKRLFRQPVELRMIDTRRFDGGTVLLSYK